MTDTPQEPQTPQEPAPGPQEPPQPLDQAQVGKDERRRERLRQVEAENAQLRAQLQGIRRNEAEVEAAKVLHDGRDLWTSVALPEILTEDGELDHAALTAQLQRLKQEHPHWTRQPRIPDAGNLTGGQGPAAPQRDWSDVLRPRGR